VVRSEKPGNGSQGGGYKHRGEKVTAKNFVDRFGICAGERKGSKEKAAGGGELVLGGFDKHGKSTRVRVKEENKRNYPYTEC